MQILFYLLWLSCWFQFKVFFSEDKELPKILTSSGNKITFLKYKQHLLRSMLCSVKTFSKCCWLLWCDHRDATLPCFNLLLKKNDLNTFCKFRFSHHYVHSPSMALWSTAGTEIDMLQVCICISFWRYWWRETKESIAFYYTIWFDKYSHMLLFPVQCNHRIWVSIIFRNRS